MDQEKAARLAVEARVAQLAEDAAGLRNWAVMQVHSTGGPHGRAACSSRAGSLSAALSGLPSLLLLPSRQPLPPQVDSVRSELGAEVAALLDAVRQKSAELADTEARLTGRLRWGVALIQAKGEAAAKRQAFMLWR